MVVVVVVVAVVLLGQKRGVRLVRTAAEPHTAEIWGLEILGL